MSTASDPDIWPPAGYAETAGIAQPRDWKALHAASRVYPVANALADITPGQSWLVGRKHAGDMHWTYTLPDSDLIGFRKACREGDITTTQVAYPGPLNERDFGLLARRTAR